MYPSKGGGGFGGQQPFGAQQGYGQIAGTGFSGNPSGGTDIGAQHAMASRQSAMMGIAQEADVGGYRVHTSQAAQYGGPYASVYGSAALSGGQQAPTCHTSSLFSLYRKFSSKYAAKVF